jgi:F0F1-type ATP synthase epsilon subunit
MPETTSLRIQLPDRHLEFPAIAILRLKLDDGWAGFLPQHAPFMALYPPGVATIEREDGPLALALAGGWVWIRRAGFTLYSAEAVAIDSGEAFADALKHEQSLRLAVETRRAEQEARLEQALGRWARSEGGRP